MSSSKALLSVVIPTKNAGNEFIQVLSNLRAQNRHGDAEIVIVDSGSTDGTVQTARSFACKIIEIEPEAFNHGNTRNLGIAESCGEYVCLLTQDAIPQGSDFLSVLVDSMIINNAAGAYARQAPRINASALVRRDVERWLSGSATKRIVTMDSANEFFASPPIERYQTCVFDDVASMIRREVWEKIPFPIVDFGEDIEWGYRVLVNGHTIVYEPRAVVEHSHERSVDYTFKRTYVDHYRLYELFGVRTIPTRRRVVRSIVWKCLLDWGDLLRSPEFSFRRLKEWAQTPAHAWASAWGQYRGARDAAQGFPLRRSRDV
ncbi:MAG: glycosyltransferase [Candidatus Omnitrophota bacterium]|jgi:rhamnosyltransferase|nr:MAG: glycosyltransferase [Candidatus Omnitrophota bacterium]